MDATGDGEWGIALRSARDRRRRRVRLFAGCGIVADSDPEAELAEAQAKFVPVRDALTASGPDARLNRPRGANRWPWQPPDDPVACARG